jgi:hypothetical protein
MKNEKMKCTHIIEKAFDPNSAPADSKKIICIRVPNRGHI